MMNAVIAKTIPKCPICGREFQESGIDPALFSLEHIGDRLRFAPTCNCLEREHHREEGERLQRRAWVGISS